MGEGCGLNCLSVKFFKFKLNINWYRIPNDMEIMIFEVNNSLTIRSNNIAFSNVPLYNSPVKNLSSTGDFINRHGRANFFQYSKRLPDAAASQAAINRIQFMSQ